MSKWWLLSDEDFCSIAKNLTQAIEECCDADSKKLLEDTQHTLETGLHVTDAVPSDFKNKEHRSAPEYPPATPKHLRTKQS